MLVMNDGFNGLTVYHVRGAFFVVIPDVSRRPDGALGGDPIATWAKFQELALIVREMGFPVGLAAQDGIEHMPNLQEQLDACDCLCIARMARNAGKWVHMLRANSRRRLELARLTGCQSVDGTYLRFPDVNAPKLVGWLNWLDAHPVIPGMFEFESPSHPNHRGVQRVLR